MTNTLQNRVALRYLSTDSGEASLYSEPDQTRLGPAPAGLPTFPAELQRAVNRSAESRYKGKKEVPRADGKGTTTVYEYSDRQVQHRNRQKADKLEKLRKSLGGIRSQVSKDLTSSDERTRLTALVVGLMDHTYERVGNQGSAEKGHFGVTGFQTSHVTFQGGKATIKYVGKSGVKQEKTVTDKSLIRALKKAIEGKGKDECIFLCSDGRVDASRVNEYLSTFGATAKDIRGLHANREMQDRLRAARSRGGPLPSDKKKREDLLKGEFQQALEASADSVGHDPSTLRGQYLVPGLEDSYLRDGKVTESLKVSAQFLRRAAMAKYAEIRLCVADQRKEAIIGLYNAWPNPKGTGDLEGFEGLTSSLTTYEWALVNDMDRSREPLVVEGNRYLFRGYEIPSDVVEELQGAAYLGSVEGGVIQLSPQFEAKIQLYRTATKSDSEREEAEVERLIRPAPKKKPPRKDRRRERVDTESPAAEDRDLSLNYKKVAFRWVLRQGYAQGPAPKDPYSHEEFLKAQGDKEVKSPDSGEKVMVRSLKGDKGKGEKGGEFQAELFKKWQKDQKEQDETSDDPSEDEDEDDGGEGEKPQEGETSKKKELSDDERKELLVEEWDQPEQELGEFLLDFANQIEKEQSLAAFQENIEASVGKIVLETDPKKILETLKVFDQLEELADEVTTNAEEMLAIQASLDKARAQGQVKLFEPGFNKAFSKIPLPEGVREAIQSTFKGEGDVTAVAKMAEAYNKNLSTLSSDLPEKGKGWSDAQIDTARSSGDPKFLEGAEAGLSKNPAALGKKLAEAKFSRSYVTNPMVLGGVKVSDDKKSAKELQARGDTAIAQYARMDPQDIHRSAETVQSELAKLEDNGKGDSHKARELQTIHQGLRLSAMIAGAGTLEGEVDHHPSQFKALAKKLFQATGKEGKDPHKAGILLDRLDDFSSGDGRIALSDAMSQLDDKAFYEVAGGTDGPYGGLIAILGHQAKKETEETEADEDRDEARSEEEEDRKKMENLLAASKDMESLTKIVEGISDPDMKGQAEKRQEAVQKRMDTRGESFEKAFDKVLSQEMKRREDKGKVEEGKPSDWAEEVNHLLASMGLGDSFLQRWADRFDETFGEDLQIINRGKGREWADGFTRSWVQEMVLDDMTLNHYLVRDLMAHTGEDPTSDEVLTKMTKYLKSPSVLKIQGKLISSILAGEDEGTLKEINEELAQERIDSLLGGMEEESQEVESALGFREFNTPAVDGARLIREKGIDHTRQVQFEPALESFSKKSSQKIQSGPYRGTLLGERLSSVWSPNNFMGPGTGGAFKSFGRIHVSQKRITKKGALAVSSYLDRLATLVGQDWRAMGLPEKVAKDMVRRCDLLSDHVETHAGMDPKSIKAGTPFDPSQIAELEKGPLRSDPDEGYTKVNFTQQEFHELGNLQEKGQLGNAAKMAQALREAAEKLEATAGVTAKVREPVHGFNLFA